MQLLAIKHGILLTLLLPKGIDSSKQILSCLFVAQATILYGATTFVFLFPVYKFSPLWGKLRHCEIASLLVPQDPCLSGMGVGVGESSP